MTPEWEKEATELSLIEMEKYLKETAVKENVSSELLYISTLRCQKMCKPVLIYTCPCPPPICYKRKILSYTAGRNVDKSILYEIQYRFFNILKIDLPHEPRRPLLGIY